MGKGNIQNDQPQLISDESKDVVVSVKGLAKTFHLPKEHSNELKQTVINFFKHRRGYTDLRVLRDINFEVHKGDFFGIVGRNGSGKSTLLKLLAGIYQPTRGTIKTKGKIVPFIELGVGFNPELTGRENVYMNGAMLGFSNKEMDAMYDDIVDFAELSEFMDQKLKNYSSGMQVRLAFSIAIKAQGDILILDEVLAVGDEAFQRKCSDFFAEIKKDKTKTIILVTHDMASVKKYCNKAMMISSGDVVRIGSPDDVANEYSMENLSAPITADDTPQGEKRNVAIEGLSAKLISAKQISRYDKLIINIEYTIKKSGKFQHFVYINDLSSGLYLVGAFSKLKMQASGKVIIDTVEFDLSELNDGSYVAGIEVFDSDGNIVEYVHNDQQLRFMIRNKLKKGEKQTGSLLSKQGRWYSDK